MALATARPFNEVFHGWNPHMVCIEVADGVYVLDPPNQLDWSYTVSRLPENRWRVQGKKPAHYDIEETCDDVYRCEKGRWVRAG